MGPAKMVITQPPWLPDVDVQLFLGLDSGEVGLHLAPVRQVSVVGKVLHVHSGGLKITIIKKKLRSKKNTGVYIFAPSFY